MKQIEFTPRFRKQYKLRISPYRKLVEDLLNSSDMLQENPNNELLKRKHLRAPYKGLESIRINDDYRIVFFETKDKFIFHEIGNHKQLFNN